MSIFLMSNDKFLFNFIKNNVNTDVYFGDSEDIDYNKYFIFIFDLTEEEKIKNIMQNIDLNFNLVININKFRIENIINIELPFKVNILKDHIDTYISYINKYCIFDDKFKLNKNKNTVFINNKNIQLTEKECLLISTLYNMGKVNKDELLKIVCGGYDNSKAIETLIYNIRFKLKNNGIEDFVSCQNGYYKLNLI